MRKLLNIFFGVFAFLLIAGVVFIFSFDINSYKAKIEETLKEGTGYTFILKGKMSISRSFNPVVEALDVEIKSSIENQMPTLLMAKKAQISLDLRSLLQDVILIHSVSLEDVKVQLQVNNQGEKNWILSDKNELNEKKTESRPALRKTTANNRKKSASITLFDMKNLLVSYNDENKNFSILFPELRLSNNLTDFSGKFVYKNIPFDFNGNVQNFLTTLQTQHNFNFSGHINSSLLSADVSGLITDLQDYTRNATLNMNLQGTDLKKLVDFVGLKSDYVPSLDFNLQSNIRLIKPMIIADGKIAFPSDNNSEAHYTIEQNMEDLSGKGRLNLSLLGKQILKEYGLEPFSMQASYSLSDKKLLEISNVSAMFDETDIKGSGKIDFSIEKPVFNLSLFSHYFKLSNVIDLSSNNKKQADGLKKLSWSFFDFLKSTDGQFDVKIDNLSVANVLLNYPRVFLFGTLRQGNLDLFLKEGSVLAEGKVVGNLSLNANLPIPTLKGEVVAQNLQVNQLNMWKKSTKEGDISLNIKIDSKGKNKAEMLSNLNGTILLSANKIVILSSSLMSLVKSSSEAIQRSYEVFVKCAMINAQIKDSVILFSHGVGLEIDKYNIIMDGSIDLRQKNVSLVFIPQYDGNDLSVNLENARALVVSGTFDNLEFQDKNLDKENFTRLMPKKQRTEKQVFLDNYTKKTGGSVSVCKIVKGNTVMKDIDAYFGRIPVKIKKEVKPTKVVEETVLEKKGREFFQSFSKILPENTKALTSNK